MQNPTTKKFHKYHGSNVLLECDGTLASRKTSYANALVFSETPLRPNDIFLLQIEEIQRGWSGDLRIGLTTMNPDEAFRNKWPLPQYALPDLTSIKPSWIFCLSKSGLFNRKESWICSSAWYNRLRSSQLNFGSLNDKCATDVGSQIGLVYIPTSPRSAELHFIVNGVDQGVYAVNIPYSIPLFVVIDVYGCTKKVRVIKPRFNVHSLQEICRESILHNLQFGAVQMLPLPTALKNYLLKPIGRSTEKTTISAGF